MSKKTLLMLIGVFFTGIIIIRVLWSYQLTSGVYDIFRLVYSITVTVFVISTIILAELYHPKWKVITPSVSIIVPVYNEQTWIAKTVVSCVSQVYDNIKEVIIVNDGSTDNTRHEIIKLLFQHAPVVKVVSLSSNKGKRQAMVSGVNVSRGEIIVFIDSDTILDPNAIGELVKPFAKDKIHAVVGHCDVYPVKNNMTEKLQHAWYFTGYKLFKSAEALFGAVTCLSGTLSAYRRDKLIPILDKFINQKYLGATSTLGDDSALTTLLLKRGAEIVYQEHAKCQTVVPDNMKQLVRQRFRWSVSRFRENLLLMPYYWKRGIIPAFRFYASMFLSITAPIITVIYLIIEPIKGNYMSPVYFISGCMAIGLVNIAYYLWHTDNGSIFANLFYWLLNIWFAMWLLPATLLRIRERKWITR